MTDPTENQSQEAADLIPSSWRPPQGAEEIWCVLDAVANGEEPTDALDEWRHWRSSAGRQQEQDELYESAHPMSDLVR